VENDVEEHRTLERESDPFADRFLKTERRETHRVRPGRSRLTTKRPSGPVAARRLAEVSSFSTVTVASATGFPAGSTTLPEMLAVTVWARAGWLRPGRGRAA